MKPIYDSLRDSFNRAVYRLHSNVISVPAASIFADENFFKIIFDKPQTIFFRLDKELNVVSNSCVNIETLYNCLVVSKNCIPIFYLDSIDIAQNLANFVYYHSIGDAAICVPYEKRDVLSQALLLMPMLRGMLDCRGLNENPDWLYVAGQSWSVGSISLLIDEKHCDRDTVNILHERVVSVWCETKNDPADIIFDGVDGVVSNNLCRIYSVLDLLPENSLLDGYRIFAHKGFQNGYTMAENSITAVKRSAEIGMNGAEIDVKLTTDGIPFVIHNPSTKAMLKGEERIIETLSAEELASRERTDFPNEYVDRLEDMLNAVKDYRHHQMFIEFKPTSNFHHIEKMTHAIKGIIERTKTEHISVALNGHQGMKYIQRLLPTLPKLCSVWEEPCPPDSDEEANGMLYRFCCCIEGTPAALCLEDVMVNRRFGEVAAIRGMFTIVWTRSWYFKHSLWENDGERSDEGFLSGYYATISDHSEKYLYIPMSIELNTLGKPMELMRDGMLKKSENTKIYDIGNGKRVFGVEITLPFGKTFHMFSKVFNKTI